MEMTTGSSVVVSTGRRRLCNVEGEAMAATKSVAKRRKRDPLAVALNSNGGDEQNTTTTTTPTATTLKRSSRFRGVSRHRWTGRFEAHLWDKGSWNPTQRKKGKQVYLGAYDDEESAARAYDLAALKYWGTSTFTNFPVSEYEKELEMMQNMTKEEYLATLRRRSSGFSRGVSKYRGVARHHHNGRWEARIGRVFGNKYLYLGTYSTQEEAAHAYDIAAIEYRGINAVTNFDLSTYIRWLKPEANSPAPHESKPALGPLPLSDHFPSQKTNHLAGFRHSNPFMVDDSNTSRKQPNSSYTKTPSPTALGLLLKSSIFKELVEKNSNATKDETEENDAKMFQMTNNNDEVGDIFCNGISQSSYMCSSSRDSVITGSGLKEESNTYDRLDHFLFNGSFNMPSLH